MQKEGHVILPVSIESAIVMPTKQILINLLQSLKKMILLTNFCRIITSKNNKENN